MIGASGCSVGANDFCVVAGSIRPLVSDTCGISQTLTDQILAHNEIGAELCGWKGENKEATCEVKK